MSADNVKSESPADVVDVAEPVEPSVPSAAEVEELAMLDAWTIDFRESVYRLRADGKCIAVTVLLQSAYVVERLKRRAAGQVAAITDSELLLMAGKLQPQLKTSDDDDDEEADGDSLLEGRICNPFHFVCCWENDEIELTEELWAAAVEERKRRIESGDFEILDANDLRAISARLHQCSE